MTNPWFQAIRPKTLPAAVAPVLIGSAMAFGDGMGHWPSVFFCLLGALSLQAGTNLVNDYCDFKKGADTPERLGPVRVTQAGLVKPEQVMAAAAFSFAVTILCAIFLYARAGHVVTSIAVASILAGIFYTAGKRPLGYLGLGDMFVFVFFGPVAVAGTYYVQTLDMNWAVLAAGAGPGFLSTAILAVNNLRDIATDLKAGKRTLAVRFGRGFACAEFLFCMIAAALSPWLVFLITYDHEGMLLASLAGFLSIPLMIHICTKQGAELNDLLAKTGQLLLIYSMLFSFGWILWSR